MRSRVIETLAPVVRPKVTPDPSHAAELERRRAQLEYRPQSGFLLEVPRGRTWQSQRR